jgi:transcriptional regulator GlxA family with amidase domain
MQIRHDDSTCRKSTIRLAGNHGTLSVFPCHFCHFPQFAAATGAAKLPGMASATIRHRAHPITSRQQVVEQVEAFLSARIGETVSIARLCQVAGVSERSLRNAFYDVRGMSPKRCVVRARLAEVRRALSSANGTRGAVTTIATDYGFFELGRFARTYKEVFGESPSATLRSQSGAEASAAS